MRRTGGSVWERHRVASDGTEYVRWVAQVSKGPRGGRRAFRRVFLTREEAELALPDMHRMLPDRRSRLPAPAIVTRFYSHVDKTSHPGGCWEWTAFRYPTGYGAFNRDGKSTYAHRVALEMHIGRPLDPGEWALHKCDNAACVRVDGDHVYLGNAKDNARDRRKRVAA